MEMETWLHVGAVLLPIPAAIIAFFLRQVMVRLERVEEKLDVAAVERGVAKTEVLGLDHRVTRLEDWKERAI